MINEGIKSGERDKKGENGFGVFFVVRDRVDCCTQGAARNFSLSVVAHYHFCPRI